MSESSAHARIDVHHHPMYEFWREAIAAHSPGLGIPEPTWEAPRALELMDATGVRAAVLSMAAPGVHFGDDAAARALARCVNEAHAGVVAARPGDPGPRPARAGGRPQSRAS